jgi:Domain of unknown function (DUF305)
MYKKERIMKHSHNSPHYFIMILIMFGAGLLSTMNMWTVSFSHVYFSLNDLYMITLMTSWMIVGMAIYHWDLVPFLLGLLGALLSLTAIRQQWFVGEKQWLRGMIPHHSMALLMSRELLKRPNTIEPLLKSILKTQEQEIQYMKGKLEN